MSVFSKLKNTYEHYLTEKTSMEFCQLDFSGLAAAILMLGGVGLFLGTSTFVLYQLARIFPIMDRFLPRW